MTPLPGGKVAVTTRGATTGASGVFRFYRLDAQEQLDTTYAGGTGYAQPPSYSQGGPSTAVDSSGRAWSTDILFGSGPVTGGQAISLIRLDASGVLDTAWGTGGKRSFGSNELPAAKPFLESGALSAAYDGRLYVAGRAQTGRDNPIDRDWVAFRIDASGALDTTWGDRGLVSIRSNLADVPNVVHAGASGHLYLVGFRGNATGDVEAVRFTSAGLLDTAWGNQGKALLATGLGHRINAMAEDAQGRLVAVGVIPASLRPRPNSAGLVVRLTAQGALDTSFGTGGRLEVDFVHHLAAGQAWNDVFTRLWFDGTSTYVSGMDYSSTSNQPEYATVIRVTEGGVLDPTFASSSKLARVSDVGFVFESAARGSEGNGAFVFPHPDGVHLQAFGNFNGLLTGYRWK